MGTPLKDFAIGAATGSGYTYRTAFGVAWFLLWLHIFNMMYLLLCRIFNLNNIRINLPSNLVQLGYGIFMGAVQALIAYAQGGHQWQWGFLRMQWAYFPSFVSFYFMGTLAK